MAVWRARWLRASTWSRRQASIVDGSSVDEVAVPRVDHLFEGVVEGRGVSDPVVACVPAQGLVESSCAEICDGGAFGVVGLADVVVENGDEVGVAVEEGGHGAAGPDGTELARVADEDEARAGGLDGGDEAEEVVVGGHGCFVEDDGGVGVEPGVAVVQSPQQRRDRRRFDVGLATESAGGLAGGGGAEHPPAAGLEGGGGGVESGGLAGAGDADDELHPGGPVGERGHGGGLTTGEPHAELGLLASIAAGAGSGATCRAGVWVSRSTVSAMACSTARACVVA